MKIDPKADYDVYTREIDQLQRRKAETEILMRILIAQLLAKVALWIRIQATQKYKRGDISKGPVNTLYPAKKIYKRTIIRLSIFERCKHKLQFYFSI